MKATKVYGESYDSKIRQFSSGDLCRFLQSLFSLEISNGIARRTFSRSFFERFRCLAREKRSKKSRKWDSTKTLSSLASLLFRLVFFPSSSGRVEEERQRH